ncbi:transcriptional regulator [Shinella kummerowiae]|uniref:transcriptional regulator n=1 Tax=Shinella kummerowiae TaxID=417745 RepID=UPI0021B5F54D|nr:transcriptional regulator [Shinella kummerowiae]MCT7664245.1 transcriptional regulator [Shinella kummerowiae]
MTSHPSGQTLIEAVSADLPELNKTFRRVAQYMLSAPEGFMHKPVQEIAAAAEVSEPSVIRFCRRYGFKGIPDFRIALAMALVHGPAAERSSFLEPQITDKAVVNLASKRAIARFARTLIGTDRSIIIDSGSTAQLFAETLRDADALAVMTTGLNIVDALRGATQHSIMLPGGVLRHESRSLSGRMVESTLANMHFDTLYLGADAIDPVSGLSTFNEEEAHQNTAMIAVSRRVVVLADSTKFRAPGLHRFCEIERIHTIVTDTCLGDDVVEAIEARGVVVHRVDPIEEKKK